MDARGHTGGFTLIELIIVITVIGILLTVGLVAQSNLRDYATDRERGDDVASIARRLEQAYTNQDIGSASYPSTAEIIADATGRTRTLSGINADALAAPGTTRSAIVPATSPSISSPTPDPTSDTYVYLPLTTDDSLCTADPSTTLPADNCVRFFLYYRTLIGKKLVALRSMHQQ